MIGWYMNRRGREKENGHKDTSIIIILIFILTHNPLRRKNPCIFRQNWFWPKILCAPLLESICSSRSGTRVQRNILPYLRVYKPHFFDKNLPSKIGVRLIHGIKKNIDLPRKISYQPMTPVLHVVKPPVETASSRHHRLSIDSQKSEDQDISDRLS
jgi:hypothetical protein